MNIGKMKWQVVVGGLGLLGAACGGSNDGPLGVAPGSLNPAPIAQKLRRADLRADVNRDGVVDVTGDSDAEGKDNWSEARGAVFLANIDDDSARCRYSASQGDDALAKCHDGADEVVNGEDDLLDMAELRVQPWADAPEGMQATLTVAPPADTFVRLFKNTGRGFVVVKSGSALTVEELRAGLELRLEGKDVVRDAAVWNGYADLELAVTAPSVQGTAAVDEKDTVRLRVSPLMTFHHLTAAETAYVSRVPRNSWGSDLSTTFVNGLKRILDSVGIPLVEVPTDDLWNQDYFETAFMSMPARDGAQHVIRVNMRSANIYQPESATKPLREAGRVVFQLRGKDVAALAQYDRRTPDEMQTLNSFGNAETIPPFELDGVRYPMGRVLRGSVSNFYADPSFVKMFESQQVQKPVYIDTSWLAVAHVDETISFVRANNARGWVMLVGDPAGAVKMLEDAQAAGAGNAILFKGLYRYDFQGNANDPPVPAQRTITQVLNDQDVMDDTRMAAEEIATQVEILKRETGLTDAEIVKIPFLEEPTGFGSIAYQPGTVNGFYVDDNTFIAPEPYGPVVNGVDIFKVQMEQALGQVGVNVRWLDDWDLYHVNMGEVHCGTNTARVIPSAKWWEAGR